ncbi:hypothetical protein RB595_002141 [Gaeumannomyces hyphopodioides]
MISLCKVLVASTLALQAAAKTIQIDVGKNGLRFSPNVTEAAKGDVLEFHFFAVNHSVVEGRFDAPCQPARESPVFSGFTGPIQAGQEGPNVFQVTVNDTKPLVFYCSQNTGFHCARGMYAVVNPGPAPQSIEGYGSGIRGNVTAVSPPGGPRGGVFRARGGSGSVTTTATPPPSAPTDNANATTTTTPGNGGADATTTPTGGAGSNPQTTSKPAAGANFQAPVGGVLGAVLAAALML